MLNLFGISGQLWSLGVEILGLVVSFGLGLSGCKRCLIGIAIAVGLGSDFVGQTIFAGGGPGACVGLLVLPIYCLICAGLGRGIWWLAWGRHQRPIPPGHCRNCSYNLTGNVSGICPECGTAIAKDAKAGGA